MKIVEIIPQLSSGGAERFTVDLCNELVNQGHDVTLITLYRISNNPILGFYATELSKKVKLIECNKNNGFNFSLLIRLYKVINRIKPDVIHTHLRAIPYTILLHLSSKYRFFHTIHNDAKKEASDLINRFIRNLLFKSKKCHPITISEESDSSFVKYYGNKTPRTLIKNGSPLKQTNVLNATEIISAKKNGKTILVNVARLEQQKNQKSLIEAVKDISNIELFIIGDYNTNYGKGLSSILPLNVHFLGQKNNPRDYIKAADAFILSSVYEGMPITLIECFSVGSFPIVTPVGGIINMVKDRKNGLVCHSPNSNDIHKTIIDFLNINVEERNLIRQQSYKSFQEYSIEISAKKYINLFKH